MREGLTRAGRGRSRRPAGGRRILALFAIACMPASICGAEAGEEGRPFLSALSPELAARIEVVKWDGQRELLGIGAGIAVVIAALTFFLSQKTPRKD